MKIIHRQIFKELITLFGLSTACLLSLIIMGRMLQLRDLFLSQNLGLLDLFQLFFYLCPFFLLLIMPIACMLSVFLTFLRMSSENEHTALKANGVSLYQLLPAPLLFGCLCTVGCYFIAFYGLSWGMENFKSTIIEYAKTRSKLAIQPGVFNRDFPNLTFYAHKVDNSSGELESVFVQDTTIKGTTITVVAPKGRIETNAQKGEINIHFSKGRIFRKQGEELNILQFGTYTVRLPLGELLGGFRFDPNKPSHMSITTLWNLYKYPPPRIVNGSKYYYLKLTTELVKRWTLPLGCLILGLFAFPVACAFRGLRKQYGLLLSMGLFLLYYTCFSVAVSLGETGSLSPHIGLWLPNIVFLAIGCIGIYYTNQEKTLPVMTLLNYWQAWRARA